MSSIRGRFAFLTALLCLVLVLASAIAGSVPARIPQLLLGLAAVGCGVVAAVLPVRSRR
ncbi:MAG: hypothetical protein LKF88_00045 [Microbacteriaceae bacterium]|jgi:uncharacterized membrane protein|nr:hypothetical protein [Microbacteriaceae bacterium]MCI1207369.1 hypothetical protein [Microbacteriaceae bacterium]